MRKPDPGPLGDTFFDDSVRTIVVALFVKSPEGGCVESVFTFEIHRFVFRFAMSVPFPNYSLAFSVQAKFPYLRAGILETLQRQPVTTPYYQVKCPL